MKHTIERHGQLFIGVAFVAAVTGILVPRMSPSAELLLIGALIVLTGVPHGALDTVFARTRYDLTSWQRWMGFALVYCGVASSVVLLWLYSPTLFLIGFLILSGAHFSGDPTHGTSVLSRIAYGGAILILPSLRFGAEFKHLLGVLVGTDAAAKVVPWIGGMAALWVCLLVFSALREWRRSRRTALELVAVGAIALCVPPLLSFTLFFCAMHSARHILRTFSVVEPRARKGVAAAGLLPMIGVVVIGALLWRISNAQAIETKVIQLLFVGLAALTVPHMAIVEPFRMRGWPVGPYLEFIDSLYSLDCMTTRSARASDQTS